MAKRTPVGRRTALRRFRIIGWQVTVALSSMTRAAVVERVGSLDFTSIRLGVEDPNALRPNQLDGGRRFTGQFEEQHETLTGIGN
ncbi:hypothetical protein [Rhodococcus sp. NCIMB 12038]|uniref:hypothetical protein n=1 Tax=Rhodococcus sp. NCIMB 12038 TaxID=933800 RepID=UPI000B3C4075|nr:hypothetical protein [Rhodococcus sp. NCIMB 12038]OUS97264.1 hypothetical protein CA951_02645 [Rhodococcus sp. NCIMB 12038]